MFYIKGSAEISHYHILHQFVHPLKRILSEWAAVVKTPRGFMRKKTNDAN